jgi:hypothetical protein
MNIINVIAYRSDGSDYCRGCLMGSSSSDLEIFNTTNIDEAIEFAAKKRVEDNHSEREYNSHELTFIIDGRVVSSCEGSWYPDGYDEDGTFEKYDALDTYIRTNLERRVKEIEDARIAAAALAKQRAEEAKEKQKAAEKIIAAEKHRQYIIEEFNKLQTN